MDKKADMSIQTIVAAALAMIILIILIVVFKSQIGNIAGGFTSTGNDAKAGLSGTKCLTLIGGRACSTNIPTGYDKIEPPIPKPCKEYIDPKDQSKGCKTEGWIDCSAECYEIEKKEI